MRLVVAAARPAPGNRADARVWRESGLPAHCAGATVLGDSLHHAVQAIAHMRNLALAA